MLSNLFNHSDLAGWLTTCLRGVTNSERIYCCFTRSLRENQVKSVLLIYNAKSSQELSQDIFHIEQVQTVLFRVLFAQRRSSPDQEQAISEKINWISLFQAGNMTQHLKSRYYKVVTS